MAESNAPTQAAYVPGVCNINRAEIARRRMIGYIGLVVLAFVEVAVLVLDLNHWVRLVAFVPAFMAASGFLQAKNRFCSGYGSRGQQNATEGSAKASAVTDEAALRKDRRRAMQINVQAAGMGLLVTLLFLVLP